MAFKLKRNRRKKKKILSKEDLRKRKLALMKRKLKRVALKKIKSKKLNNNKQDEKISISINITNDNTGESTKDLDWSTPDHYKSAAGSYRKARIDNRKY
tara:strand:+ start:1181 stop:1477 length:297 start_codon:yes stop_codon:yes gene_type:complete